MQIQNIKLKWLGHAGFLINNSKKIYIDPFNIPDNSEKADIILITHGHYDHCSFEDLYKITEDGTKIFMTADCQSKIMRFDKQIKIQIVEPNQEYNLEGIRIITIPSYNQDKQFHQKTENWVGYVIKIGNIIIYHAGDTDAIPEMEKLTGHKQKANDFIALLPVGGRFTMNAEEAAEAARIIQPTIAIPMHYGTMIGNEEDAQEFVDLCKENNINTEILKKDN